MEGDGDETVPAFVAAASSAALLRACKRTVRGRMKTPERESALDGGEVASKVQSDNNTHTHASPYGAHVALEYDKL